MQSKETCLDRDCFRLVRQFGLVHPIASLPKNWLHTSKLQLSEHFSFVLGVDTQTGKCTTSMQNYRRRRQCNTIVGRGEFCLTDCRGRHFKKFYSDFWTIYKIVDAILETESEWRPLAANRYDGAIDDAHVFFEGMHYLSIRDSVPLYTVRWGS